MNRFKTKRVAKWVYDYSSYATSATFAAATIADATDIITIANHPFETGDLVGLVLTPSSGVTSTLPALSTAYYVIYLTKDTIGLATSKALAFAGTKTNLTGGSAADCLLVKNAFGVVKSGVMLPANAVITNCVIDVDTTFQSLDTIGGNVDAATIGLGIGTVSAGTEDLVVGIAISDASNRWDAGIHATLAGMPNFGADAAHDSALEVSALFAGSYINLSADSELIMNIGVDPLTAGKMSVYIEYIA